jgi:hypothetical protein
MPQCKVEVILVVKIAMYLSTIAFGQEYFANAFRERPQIVFERGHALTTE